MNYAAGFGLPAGVLLLSLLVFYSARRKYTQTPPTGSVLAKFVGYVL